jgi:hypothetical protein
MIVMIMLGTPKSRINLLSKPCRKNVVAPTLADKCVMAAKIKAVLKSTNKRATGKKMVEVPNPATVPITIDINATKKNKI